MSLSPEIQAAFDDFEKRHPEAPYMRAAYEELIDLSINIKRLRTERGWGRRELAKRLDTSAAAIFRWEQPIPSMNLESLVKLAGVFKVSIKELLEVSEAKE